MNEKRRRGLARRELLKFLPGMVTGRLHLDHPAVWTGHCRQARVDSEKPLTVHIDGEFFCLPADDIRAIEVQLLPGALRVFGRLGPS